MKNTKRTPPVSDIRIARERERFRTNRKSILHAAEAVVCRKGLDATSMDDVAAEAGFSKATLYRYVRGKGELVFELLIHFLEDLDLRLKPIVSGPGDPPAKLLGILREFVRFQSEKENLAKVIASDASFLRVVRAVVDQDKPSSKPESDFLRRLGTARETVFAEAETLLREGIASGDFRPLDVKAAAFYIGAVIHSYSHEKIWLGAKPNPEKDVLNIHAFILRGLEARPQDQA